MASVDRPQVLHVLEAIEGGTARHVVDLVRHVEGAVHHVAVPGRRVGGQTDVLAVDRMRDAGATVHLVRMTRTPWTLANLRALTSLRSLSRRFDVLHGHSAIGGLLARVAGAGRVPVVYTPNGITVVRAGLLVERLLGPLTARFVAVSPSEGEDALRNRLATSRSLVVVPNALDAAHPGPATCDLRHRLGLPAATPLVGSVSRLVPQKAPLDLLRAMAYVVERTDAHAVVLGDGPLRMAFDAARRALPAATAARIHRLDDVPDAATVLDQLDVFLLTSRFEGAPYAPMEAMRAGTAVVLTAVTGNVDTVLDGRTGLLVPPGDPDAAGDAVLRLLADEAERTRLAGAGQRWVHEQRDPRVMGERLGALYAACAATGARGSARR